MADLVMCRGDGCPLKDKCHRHTAIPVKYQHFVDTPYNHEKKCFDIFWNNKKKKQRIHLLEELTQLSQEMGMYD